MHVTTGLERELRSHAKVGALLGAGTLLWGVAVLGVGVVGDQLLPAGRPTVVLSSFALSVPVTVLVVFSVFSLLDVPPERRLAATVLLAVPGMLIQGATTAVALSVSVAAPLALSSPNSAFIVWLYALVLLIGIAPLVRPIVERDAEADASADTDAGHETSSLDAEGSVTGED